MLIDTHIHVGQFNDLYFAPSTLHELMEQLNVDFYAVSSTTQCEENYRKVLLEMKELIRLDGRKVLPVMWITPEALQGNIAWYLESDIHWRMLKIHPFLNKTEWNPSGELFAEVLDIARELKIPLLLHTGNEECCQATLYEDSIKNNKDITFILAHGRPIESSIRIARNNMNAYVDSAFMPIEHFDQFIRKGLADKLLWGTDMCIPKYFFQNIDLYEYYVKKLNSLQSICSQEQFNLITYKNAQNIYDLK